MIQINTPVGSFTFAGITLPGASVGKVRLGLQETDAEIEQHNKLFNSGTFLVNGGDVFKEIEGIKKRFPAKPSILDILEVQLEILNTIESLSPENQLNILA